MLSLYKSKPIMDNNFSAQVKEIISFSREEALRLGNDFIGTEHLLLGLIRDGENIAIKVLKQLNVDLYELRKEIELAVKDKTGKNIANINSLPLTKQAEKVIRVTVLEAINMFEKVSGVQLNYETGPRRAGDVVAIYANNEFAVTELGWQIKYDLEAMMTTAWNWELKLKKEADLIKQQSLLN